MSDQVSAAKQPAQKQTMTFEDHIQAIIGKAKMDYAVTITQGNEIARTVFEQTLGQLAIMLMQEHQIVQQQRQMLEECKTKIEKLEKNQKE